MNAAEHEERVRDFVRRVWNERDYADADRLYHASFSHPANPGLTGGAAKTPFIRAYHQAFPDLTVTIEDLVATEEAVVLRYSATGTDLGGFAGRAPSGRTATTWAVSFLRFHGEQVVSEWVGADYLGLFEHLGVLPSPWNAAESDSNTAI